MIKNRTGFKKLKKGTKGWVAIAVATSILLSGCSKQEEPKKEENKQETVTKEEKKEEEQPRLTNTGSNENTAKPEDKAVGLSLVNSPATVLTPVGTPRSVESIMVPVEHTVELEEDVAPVVSELVTPVVETIEPIISNEELIVEHDELPIIEDTREEVHPQPEPEKPAVEENKEEAPAVTPSEEAQPQPEENKPAVEENKEETPAVTPSEETQPQPEENKPAVEENKEEAPAVTPSEEAQPQPEENKPAVEENKEEAPAVTPSEEAQPQPEENKPSVEENKEEAPAVTPSEEAQPQPEEKKETAKPTVNLVEKTEAITIGEETIELISDERVELERIPAVMTNNKVLTPADTHLLREVSALGTSREKVNEVINEDGTSTFDRIRTSQGEFKVIIIEDDTIPAGELSVVEEGFFSERKTIEHVSVSADGVETVTGTEVLPFKPAVDRVVRVGTKQTVVTPEVVKEQNVKLERITKKADTVTITDPSLEKGKTIVENEGRDGIAERTTVSNYSNNELEGEPVVSTTELQSPEKRVVVVGAKEVEAQPQPEESTPAVGEDKEEVPAVTPSEEAQPQPEVEQPTVEENKEETPAVTPSEEAQPQPEPEVEKTVVEETRTVKDDESTIKETIIEDDSKYTDYRAVTEQGSPAEYTVVYRDGEEFSRTLSKEAVNRVIVVGTKAIDDTTVETITTPIANKTIEKDDASLYVGETRVQVQGQTGEKTTTITKVYKKGELVDTKTVETVTTPAIDKLVLVGTKPVITEERTTREETINFDTVYRDSNDHFEGDSIMQNPGRMGVVRITTITTKNKGVVTNTREERTVITPTENRIIIRGLKPLIKEVRTTETETINPGATQTEYDNNAPEGSRVVKQKAEAGSITYEVVRRINQKTGSVVGEEKTIINRKDAKPEVIVIGTKKATVTPQPSTPTTDKYEGLDFDDNGTGFVPAFDEVYKMMGGRPDRAALKQLAEEESWAMSLREFKDRFKFVDKDYGELYPEMSYEEESLYRFTRTNHPQAVMNSIRNKLIDEKLMKDEFLRLVNEARAQQGLAGLSYTEKGSLYDKANTQRAQEMAEHGSLRYLGTEEGKHKRPDGTRWTTVYSNQGIDVLDHFQYAGEIAAEQSGHRYVPNYLDEKGIAKAFFDSWMSSKGHRAVLMVNRDYPLTLAFDVRFGERTIVYENDYPIMVGMAEVFSVRP